MKKNSLSMVLTRTVDEGEVQWRYASSRTGAVAARVGDSFLLSAFEMLAEGKWIP